MMALKGEDQSTAMMITSLSALEIELKATTDAAQMVSAGALKGYLAHRMPMRSGVDQYLYSNHHAVYLFKSSDAAVFCFIFFFFLKKKKEGGDDCLVDPYTQRNATGFRGLVFKAHRFLFNSTLGLRVMKRKKRRRIP